MKSYFQRKCRESRENVFPTFKEKVTGIKFHKNSRIKMSREFKVANSWKGRKICREMYLIEQTSCNFCRKSKKEKKKKNENKCERWKVALLHCIGKNKRRKCFSKKLRKLNFAISEEEEKVAKDKISIATINSRNIFFVRVFFL